MEGSDFPTEPEKSNVVTPEGKAQNNLQKFEEKSMKEQLLIMFSALPKRQQADMLSSWHGSSTKMALGESGESGETKYDHKQPHIVPEKKSLAEPKVATYKVSYNIDGRVSNVFAK